MRVRADLGPRTSTLPLFSDGDSSSDEGYLSDED